MDLCRRGDAHGDCWPCRLSAASPPRRKSRSARRTTLRIVVSLFDLGRVCTKGENLRDSINSRTAFETLRGPRGWLCLPAKYFEQTEVQISDCRQIGAVATT